MKESASSEDSDASMDVPAVVGDMASIEEDLDYPICGSH